MTAAFAPTVSAGDITLDGCAPIPGAQILLTIRPARQFFLAEILAVAIYALIIAAGLNHKSKPIEAPPEEPMELVLAPAEPPPPEPPPPPPELKQPEPEPPPPPPPEAVAPPVAPVEPPPPKPKIEKPKPKLRPLPKPVPKVVEHKLAPKVDARPKPQQHVAPTREMAAPARPVPAGATASVIANQLHGCLLRAGANLYPESQRPRSATVAYRASISASGSVSFSWSSSGNPAFDSAARQAGGRCSSVQAPGRPAALSGSISFRS